MEGHFETGYKMAVLKMVIIPQPKHFEGPGSIPGQSADKVAPGQAFIRVLRFYLVGIFPPEIHKHISFNYHQRCIILAIESVAE